MIMKHTNSKAIDYFEAGRKVKKIWGFYTQSMI